DLDQELRVYQVWEQTYPRDWVPHTNSCENFREFGEYERALSEAQEALRLNPDHANNYSNLAFVFVSLGRQDEAKQVVKPALASGMDTPDLHILLYQVAFLEKDTKEMER